MEENEMAEEKKDIEIVTDDDSNLDISNVYDHLNLDRVRDNPEKEDIIIPGIKKDGSDNEDEDFDNDNNNEIESGNED